MGITGIEVRFEFVKIYTSHKIAIQVYFKILKFYIRLIPWYKPPLSAAKLKLTHS
jgi:hypothetical protein